MTDISMQLTTSSTLSTLSTLSTSRTPRWASGLTYAAIPTIPLGGSDALHSVVAHGRGGGSCRMRPTAGRSRDRRCGSRFTLDRHARPRRSHARLRGDHRRHDRDTRRTRQHDARQQLRRNARDAITVRRYARLDPRMAPPPRVLQQRPRHPRRSRAVPASRGGERWTRGHQRDTALHDSQFGRVLHGRARDAKLRESRRRLRAPDGWRRLTKLAVVKRREAFEPQWLERLSCFARCRGRNYSTRTLPFTPE